MRRVLILLAIIVGLAVPVVGTASAASRAKAPVESYPLGHAKSCRAGYRRETGHHRVHGKERRRYVACVEVLRAPAVASTTTSTTTTTVARASSPAAPSSPAPAPTVTLRASLDPSYIQDPSDPLEVTWSYSADANSGTTDLASIGQLPDGVLELFSDGSLVDSVEVGGSVTGSSATVTYSSFGSHTVDVVYDSGTNSATTGVESYDIEAPVVTTTSTSTTSTTTTTVAPMASMSWTGTLSQPGMSTVHLGQLPATVTMSPAETLSVLTNATGNVATDIDPNGTVDLTIAPQAGSASYTDVNGLGAYGAGSADCSAMSNYAGDAITQCVLNFDGDGTYTITASYVSNDPNYGSVTDALSTTVEVTG